MPKETTFKIENSKKFRKNSDSVKKSTSMTKFLNLGTYQQNNIAYISNNLISAKLTDMTKLEENVFWFIVSKIKKTVEGENVEIHKDKNRKIIFTIQEFLSFLGESKRPDGDTYRRIKEAILNLSKKQFSYTKNITITNGKKKTVYELSSACNLFESTSIFTKRQGNKNLDYEYKGNYAEVVLTEGLLNELSELDGEFTRVNAYLCSILPQKYAPALFRVAHSYAFSQKGTLEIPREQLEEILNTPKTYKNDIHKFNHYVIRPALDCINETFESFSAEKKSIMTIAYNKATDSYKFKLRKTSVQLAKDAVKKYLKEESKKILTPEAEYEKIESAEFQKETSVGADNDSNK